MLRTSLSTYMFFKINWQNLRVFVFNILLFKSNFVPHSLVNKYQEIIGDTDEANSNILQWNFTTT